MTNTAVRPGPERILLSGRRISMLTGGVASPDPLGEPERVPHRSEVAAALGFSSRMRRAGTPA